MSLTYRKTKNGEWVAYGPRAEFPAEYVTGKIIEVAKKDGTVKREALAGIGKTFMVGGTEMAYGYLDKDLTPAQPASRAAGRLSAWGRASGLAEPEYSDGFTASERRHMSA
jgi:hypothetical protein